MSIEETGWSRAQTERLELRAVAPGDLDVLHELLSDPRVWTHLPSGVYTSRRQTADAVARHRASWDRDGLGYWTAWLHDGSFAGTGGCCVIADTAWNLYYRFRPEQQGRGYATELARTARAAAADVQPDLPVAASVLAHNAASRATAEAAGLRLVWEGPDPSGRTAGQNRLLFADRDLTGPQIRTVLRV
jgi:RimJ/RimL family protein N-acetyltransferase